MAISKDNFIVVYNLDDIDSRDFAIYYASKHDMSISSTSTSNNNGTTHNGGIDWEVDGHFLGIQITDSSEILASENDFEIQIIEPIRDAISYSEEFSNLTIMGIILGYKIPGGFYDGGDVISATSRVSRLNYPFSKKESNKLYNRSIFKRFDEEDASFVLVCSRIDAHSLQEAKSYIDNAERLNNQRFADGTFYIDRYSNLTGDGVSSYQLILSDFYENMLPSLNLNTWGTTYQDPEIDPVIPFVENDSFVWSWFTDRATTSFFRYSNALRTFFYNADYDGGLTIRDENGKRWPYLSMHAGYASSAGAMSNPTVSGFLNPVAFFNSLLRGATIGEAFLFSVPHVNWTMSLFGDPLPYCSFPSEEPTEEDVIGEHEVWDIMARELGKTAAHLYKKASEMEDIVYEIVNIKNENMGSSAADASVTLLYPSSDLQVYNRSDTLNSQIKQLTDALFDFPRLAYAKQGTSTSGPNINDYLSDQGFKVSRLLSSVTGSAIIEEGNLYDEGWWQFEFVMVDSDPSKYVNYHFKLDVSDASDFSNILISGKNSYSLRNWTYEKEKGVYAQISFSGVSSSYIGRKIRYESRQDLSIRLNDYLTRGETYYFRVTPYNIETFIDYTPLEYTDIIWT